LINNLRDIMQNHLLQIVSILGMEKPATKSSEDIRNEKVIIILRSNLFKIYFHFFIKYKKG
jgi:glucose-6-phosphate 1-dehydrogenase